MILNISGV
jgi:hypothetical protein